MPDKPSASLPTKRVPSLAQRATDLLAAFRRQHPAPDAQLYFGGVVPSDHGRIDDGSGYGDPHDQDARPQFVKDDDTWI